MIGSHNTCVTTKTQVPQNCYLSAEAARGGDPKTPKD